MDYDNIEMREEIDITATISALEAAWRCVPDTNFADLLDIVVPAPIHTMSNEELIHELNEFVIQNS